jgi:hypothetical protein
MSEVNIAADSVVCEPVKETGSQLENKGDTSASLDDGVTIDFQRWFVNIFIIFHVLAITACNLPASQLKMSFAGLFQTYLSLTGCGQEWTMFSPSPQTTDTYLTARVHYLDNSTREYQFPRMSTLSVVSKYRQERWHQFIVNTQDNQQQTFWPFLARYVACKYNYAPHTNPVEYVDLYRHQRAIFYGSALDPRYLSMPMMTEHVLSMPSPRPETDGR